MVGGRHRKASVVPGDFRKRRDCQKILLPPLIGTFTYASQSRMGSVRLADPSPLSDEASLMDSQPWALQSLKLN